MRLEFRFNQRQLDEIALKLAAVQGGLPTVMRRAVNRTLKHGRKHSVRAIQEHWAVEQGKYIRRAIKTKKASAREKTVYGMLIFNDQGVPAHRFPFDPKNNRPYLSPQKKPPVGVGVQYRKDGDFEAIPRTWVVRRSKLRWSKMGRSGARTATDVGQYLILQRIGARNDVKHPTGPSPGEMLSDNAVLPQALKTIDDFLFERMTQETKYLLKEKGLA